MMLVYIIVHCLYNLTTRVNIGWILQMLFVYFIYSYLDKFVCLPGDVQVRDPW